MGDPKAAMDDAKFSELEVEYQRVVKMLEEDPKLASFKMEYEKLHGALEQSHDNEKKLMSKCRELNEDLLAAAAKVESVAQDSFANDEAMEANKRELEQAWITINELRDSEQDLKDQLEKMKDEVGELNDQLRDTEAMQGQPQEDVSDLIEEKASLTHRLQETTEEVLELRKQLDEETNTKIEAEKARDTCEDEIVTLKDSLAKAKAEHERELRKKATMERERDMLQAELKTAERDSESKQEALSAQQEELGKIQERVMARGKDIETLKSEKDALSVNNARLERQRDQGLADLDRSKEDNLELQRQMKDLETDMAAKKKELNDAQKFVDKLKKQVKASEETRLELEEKRNALKTENSSLERELEAQKKQVEADRKELESLARARDTLAKKTLVAGSETEAQKEMVRQQEIKLKNLDNEIASFKEEARKQRKIIFGLEKERDRHMAEAAAASSRCVQALEDRKLADNEIFDYKKKISEAEMRLKQQQSMYEQVRSDRNLYTKNFLEAQDQITEKKRKLKIMNHQIEQLKEEISSKESKLMKKHIEIEDVTQEKVKLTSQVDELKLKNKKVGKALQTQKTEKQQLNVILQKVQHERTQQMKQYEEVMGERDMLATQVTRRDDELKLVYEKIKLQQSTLSRGEKQYQNRVEEIESLRAELTDLKREKGNLIKANANSEQLKTELYQAHRDLLREKTRCRVLEEELETPMNVHRWRQLQGSDPATYEKIQKIQTLQKRLIAKTEETVEKELLLQEKEKEYMELRELLARQPGPEVTEQLKVYQQSLKEKNRQLQSMASELNMYQAESNEYKYEIERLSRELQDVKKRYFDQKRKEAAVRDRSKNLSASQTLGTTSPRFTGGGFNMSTREADKQTA